MKSIPIKMNFMLKEDFSIEKAIKILDEFFTQNISEYISISANFIDINTFDFFVVDEEFYFFEFLEKSEKDIENKIQFYNSLKKTTNNKWDIFHRYEFGYEKYKLLYRLLQNCDYYNINSFDSNGNEVLLKNFHTIFDF